jgi:hypothetical protein
LDGIYYCTFVQPVCMHIYLFHICFYHNNHILKNPKTDLPKPSSPFVFPQITCTVLLHFEHEWAFEAGFWHTIHVTLSVFPVPETSSVISIMSKSFLNPVFVLSLRSSSVLSFEIISSGKEDEVRPTFALLQTLPYMEFV